MVAALILVLFGIALYLLWPHPPGIVELRTIPTGATVWLDGQQMGVTSESPLVLEFTEPGDRSIHLHKDGFEKDTIQVYVGLDEFTEVEVVLRPPGIAFVRGGTSEMGSDRGADNERPPHDVVLRSYYVDRTEVTVARFQDFDPTFRPLFGHLSVPVTGVLWEEAKSFCESVGKRLPTEAEWERACRGPRGRDYSYGEAYDPVRGRTGMSMGDGPTEVGSFEPGSGGISDLTGNVWEWCLDWYDRDYYEQSPENHPTGPGNGTQHVFRGGAWYSNKRYSRCSHRPGEVEKNRDPSIGFRCVKDL